MLQQRKLAWADRKKKPKGDMGPGKYGGNSGKGGSYPTNRFHKTSNSRPHEVGKMSCFDVTFSSPPIRALPAGGRALKKNALVQSQFLPPIMAMAGANSLSLSSKHYSILKCEALSRGPMDGDGWGSDVYSKDQEKENQLFSRQKDTIFAGSSPGDGLNMAVNLHSASWEQKTFIIKDLDDFVRPPEKNSQSPDLYKSCLLALSSARSGGNHSKVQQVPEILQRSIGRSQQCSTQKKSNKRDLSTWRSTDELNFSGKGGGKQSSGDSAFGTDTWSENAEVDLEMGFDMSTVEMDFFTQQRIIKWILQVNAALFDPHSSEYPKFPLTEQDTSIKIVYDGD